MTNTRRERMQRKIGKATVYALQKVFKWRFDQKLEQDLRDWADRIVAQGPLFTESPHWREVSFDELALENNLRYSLFRIDTDKKRFIVDPSGKEKDFFGRTGSWIPRGTRIFYDKCDDAYVKIFEPYASIKGEARFLERALECGVYDHLCPHLLATIKDQEGIFRGYVTRAGRTLTYYEFQRYIKLALADLISAVTRETGFYFYDLFSGNFIISDGQISLIDLESVLPIEWYGQGTAFARDHLHEIDVGWEIQTKFASPKWYSDFLKELNAAHR